MAKYPDQIDFEKLHAVPATTEVEVVSEIIEETGQGKCEVEELGSCHVGSGNTCVNNALESKPDPVTAGLDSNVMNKTKMTQSNIDVYEDVSSEMDSKTGNCDGKNVNQEKLTCDEDKCVPEAVVPEVSIEDSYVNPTSPLKYSSLSFKPVSGANIVNTLQSKVEGFGIEPEAGDDEEVDNESDADNLANERTEMVHMMHSYTSFSCGDTKDSSNVDNGSNDQEIDYHEQELNEKDDYDQMWGDLWNEHYTETYWYYYNQFAEKFNQLSPKHEPTGGQNGEVVFESEFIIIPGESETITVFTEGEIFESEVLNNNTELQENETGSSCRTYGLTKTGQDSKSENIQCNCGAVETNDSVLSAVGDASKAGLEDQQSDKEEKEHLICINKTDHDKYEIGNIKKNRSSKDEETVSLDCNEKDMTEGTETEKADMEEKHGINSPDENESNDNKTENDITSGEDRGAEPEPEDGSRKKRKKKERQERQQAQTSSDGNTGSTEIEPADLLIDTLCL